MFSLENVAWRHFELLATVQHERLMRPQKQAGQRLHPLAELNVDWISVRSCDILRRLEFPTEAVGIREKPAFGPTHVAESND